MDSLQSLLPAVLRKRGLLRAAKASEIVYHADVWVRRTFRAFSDDLHVTSFRDGTLVVECAHAIALQECQMKSLELLAFLQHGGHAEVLSIRAVRAR